MILTNFVQNLLKSYVLLFTISTVNNLILPIPDRITFNKPLKGFIAGK